MVDAEPQRSPRPAILAQALFVRPLSDVSRLIAYYALLSSVILGLGLVLQGGEFFDPFTFFFSAFLALSLGIIVGPWIIIMTFLSTFGIDRGLRGVVIDQSPFVAVATKVFMAIILGLGTLASLLIVVTIVVVPTLIFPLVLVGWMFLLCCLSLYASCLLHKRWALPWTQELMRKLGDDLNDAWRES